MYTRKNKAGKIIGYRGSYWVQTSEGPKRRYVSGKNKGETRKALAKARGNRDAGLFFDAGNLTLQQYLERWLEDSVRGSVGHRTYHNYRSQARNHLIPMLGRVKPGRSHRLTSRVCTVRSWSRASPRPRCATSMPSFIGP